jgi:hypothetical protein
VALRSYSLRRMSIALPLQCRLKGNALDDSSDSSIEPVNSYNDVTQTGLGWVK